MKPLYQEITYKFIEQMEKYNMTLSQFQALMDLYNLLPKEEKRKLWCAENDMVRLEKRIIKQRLKNNMPKEVREALQARLDELDKE